jgi:hypothetical protein
VSHRKLAACTITRHYRIEGTGLLTSLINDDRHRCDIILWSAPPDRTEGRKAIVVSWSGSPCLLPCQKE